MLRKWMFRLRRHPTGVLYLGVFALLCIHVIDADDLAECRRACDEDGLAYPLPSSSVQWSTRLFAQCSALRSNCTRDELCCSVEHCRHGCALYSRESTDLKECQAEYEASAVDPQTDACFQGLWRMHQLGIRNLKAVMHSPKLTRMTSSTSVTSRTLSIAFSIVLNAADRSSLSLDAAHFVAQRRPVNETHITRWTSVRLLQLAGGQTDQVDEMIDGVTIMDGRVYQYRCVAVVAHGEHITSHTVIVRVPSLVVHPQLVVNESRQLSASSGVFVLCWRAANDRRVAQPQSYTVNVSAGGTLVKEKKTTSVCAAFDGLSSGTEYTARIAYAGTDDGHAEHEFALVGGTPSATPPTLLFANERAVFKLADAFDYVAHDDPTNVFELKNAQDSITAMAYNALTSTLYIGTRAGHIIESTTNTAIYRSMGGGGPAIRQLVVDAHADRLFVLTADSRVFECPASVECHARRRVYQLSPSPQLARMAVDTVNGFVYYVTATDGHVQAHELPAAVPLAVDGETVFLYPKPISNRALVNATSIELEHATMSLLVVTGQGEVARVDLVDRSITNTLKSHFNSAPSAYIGVGEFVSTRGRMVMVKTGAVCPSDAGKSICLFVEERNGQRLGVQQFLLSQATYGSIVAVDVVDAAAFTEMNEPPTDLQALVDGGTLKLSWRPPSALPFQASSAYSVPTYHVSARETNAETDTFAQFVKDAYTHTQYGLTEGTTLVVDVTLCDRTLNRSRCSRASRLTVVVPSSRASSKTRLLVRTAGGQMQSLSMLGVLTASASELDVKTKDSMHMAIEPSAKRVYSLDYAGTLSSTSYAPSSSSASRSLALRLPVHGERLAVHSGVSAASAIMHVSDEHSLNAYRLTGTKLNSNSRFHHCVLVDSDGSLVECAQIVAIAVEQTSATLYYWLLTEAGVVDVYAMPVFGRELARRLGSLAFVPEPIEHLYHVDGRWLYMTKGGRVVVLQTMQSTPAYLTDDAVEQLLVDWHPNVTRELSWPYPIVLVDSELQWGTSPSTSSTLYDVRVLDGAKHAVLMRTHTLENKATLTDELVIALAANRNNARLHVTVVAMTPFDRSSLGKSIRSPALPPTSVRQLRVRVEHVKRPADANGHATPVVTLTWLPPIAWNAAPFGYQVYCYKLVADGRVVYRRPGDVVRVEGDGTRMAVLVIDPSLDDAVAALTVDDRLDCHVQAMSKRPTDDTPMVGAKTDVRQAALNVSMPFYRTLIAGVPAAVQPNGAAPLQAGVASLYWVYVESNGTSSSSVFLENIVPTSTTSVYPYVVAVKAPEVDAQRRHARLVVADTRDGSTVDVDVNARAVSHLAADWNGQSVYMMATNYGSLDASTVKSMHLVRMPIDAKRVPSIGLATSLWTRRIAVDHWPMPDGAMSVDPFNSLLYYVDTSGVLTIVSLVDSVASLTTRSTLPACVDKRLDGRTVVHQFATGAMSTPRLLLVDDETRDTIAFDVENDRCVTVVEGGRINDMTIISITSGVDDTIMATTSSGRLLAYNMRTHIVEHSVALDERVTTAFAHTHATMLNANAVGQNYADLACLKVSVRPTIASTSPFTRTRQSVTIESNDRPSKCSSVLPPIVEYKSRVTSGARLVGEMTTTYDTPVVVDGTDEYADYNVSVHWANAFTLADFTSFSLPVAFTTAAGFPSSARELSVTPLTSVHVLATWKRPVDMQGKDDDELTYQSYLLPQDRVIKTALDLVDDNDKKGLNSKLFCDPTCHAIVEASSYNTDDRFTWNAYHLAITSVPLGIGGDLSSAVSPSSAYALAVYPSVITTPSPLGVLDKARELTSYSKLALKWSTTDDAWPHVRMTSARIEWRAGDNAEWTEGTTIELDALKNGMQVEGLAANQAYDVRMVGVFDVDEALTRSLDVDDDLVTLTAPISSTITLVTIRGPPGRPSNVVLHLNADHPYLTWHAPVNDGGLPIEGYHVQYRVDDDAAWTTIMATATTKLTVPHRDGKLQYKLVFGDRETVNENLRRARDLRVSAVNSEGDGEYQQTNKRDSLDDSDARLMVIAIVLAMLVLVICTSCVLLACWHHRRRRRGKGGKVKRHRVGNEFPMGQPPVVLHVTGDHKDADDAIKMIPTSAITSLPHSQRQWVTISRMLGKGAFGEVYEGLACNLPTTGHKSQRVAIKTLRQGCSNEERVKFLKEAILMNAFKHKNVVQLLGVCLETEPHWIILELMEGGDLLSYLRDCRPSSVMPSQLSLRDLMRIVVDVARGCAYLEGEHHVHRDLAARNCLVSTRVDAKSRQVKIADFGLARDVYEVDYYRMDGKGLLPIRSMPPESLVDGVFSAKSDVWSFGVLAWEVMTLGQQPYHAMSNWEVINFVRQGGRLSSPEHCPSEVFHMMNSCWAHRKDDRPTMAALLKQIELLAKLGKLNSDEPFPPNATIASTSTGGANTNGAFVVDSTASNRSSATASTVRVSDGDLFDRRSANVQSMRDVEHVSKRGKLFKSLRKESKRVRPPMAPSKEQLDESEEARRDSLHRTSWERDGRQSSAGESFTTSRADYDAQLLKGGGALGQNLVAGADRPVSVGSPSSFHQPAHVNRAFSPSNETMTSSMAYYEMPRSTVGTASTRLSPTTPDGLSDISRDRDSYQAGRLSSRSAIARRPSVDRGSLPPPPPAPDGGYRGTVIPIDPSNAVKYSSKPTEI